MHIDRVFRLYLYSSNARTIKTCRLHHHFKGETCSAQGLVPNNYQERVRKVAPSLFPGARIPLFAHPKEMVSDGGREAARCKRGFPDTAGQPKGVERWSA